ncbi:MAG: endolytic transglycosylase MltG, partial [Gammaproteobacteria bacterium]|nr:endolytic transglycosylase MltG [Gammaproteobacteria bacterium]
AINSHEAIKHELTDLSQKEILERLEIKHEHPEGLFFPETYNIHKNISDIDVLKRAYALTKKTLHDLWDGRDQDLPFETPYEALILASIVEKESAVEEERALIAGVFINRLRKNMRLQTDPTVIYGMGDNYKGDIRFRDLRNDTPYNTYTRSGLPPTPIAMPGYGAIKAVMHPAKTDYLYFVAFSDDSGRHKFSSTFAEHNKAVDKYQRKK